MALIPQRMLNAYSKGPVGGNTYVYEDGDFVINFAACDGDTTKCEAEVEPFTLQWRTVFNAQQ